MPQILPEYCLCKGENRQRTAGAPGNRVLYKLAGQQASLISGFLLFASPKKVQGRWHSD